MPGRVPGGGGGAAVGHQPARLLGPLALAGVLVCRRVPARVRFDRDVGLAVAGLVGEGDCAAVLGLDHRRVVLAVVVGVDGGRPDRDVTLRHVRVDRAAGAALPVAAVPVAAGAARVDPRAAGLVVRRSVDDLAVIVQYSVLVGDPIMIGVGEDLRGAVVV